MSQLQVLLLGRLRPELGTSGLHDDVPVADIRYPDAVQDAVTRLSDRSEPVLVVCSDSDAAEARYQLAYIDVALPRATTILETVSGPPLAVGVTAALLTDPSATPDAHAQFALLDHLRSRLWSAVWLPSVTRLTSPPPTVLQHLRSWLPGGGFLAVSGRPGAVLKAGSAPVRGLPDGPRGGALMVADNGAPAWVREFLVSVLQPASELDCTTWRDPRDVYGVGESAEFVAVPADLHDPSVVADARRTECAGCGRAHPRAVCPFCQMAADTPEVRENDRPDLSGESPAVPLGAPQ